MENKGEKRSHSDVHEVQGDVKAVLLDIEGTTTPISFVKEILFGYIRENLEEYLDDHWDTDECQDDIESLRTQAIMDCEDEVEGAVEIPSDNEEEDDDDEDDDALEKRMDESRVRILAKVKESIIWQMDKDRKSTPLKQLQGHMWRDAYKTKKVQGEVYEDVVDALKKWVSEDKKVYIYSSGSVEAQKLLFTYSDQGDLTTYLSGYFDTTTGSKVENESYTSIAEAIATKAENILFLTDNPKEARASAKAGQKATLVEREGNEPLSDDDKKNFRTISSFSELFGEDGETSAKK